MAHGKQVVNMGMTNKQFQGFIRLALELLEKALKGQDLSSLAKAAKNNKTI